MEILTVVLDAAKFIGEMIARFVEGDRAEEVMRVIDILPPTLRSRVEIEAQREETSRKLKEAFEGEV